MHSNIVSKSAIYYVTSRPPLQWIPFCWQHGRFYAKKANPEGGEVDPEQPCKKKVDCFRCTRFNELQNKYEFSRELEKHVDVGEPEKCVPCEPGKKCDPCQKDDDEDQVVIDKNNCKRTILSKVMQLLLDSVFSTQRPEKKCKPEHFLPGGPTKTYPMKEAFQRGPIPGRPKPLAPKPVKVPKATTTPSANQKKTGDSVAK